MAAQIEMANTYMAWHEQTNGGALPSPGPRPAQLPRLAEDEEAAEAISKRFMERRVDVVPPRKSLYHAKAEQQKVSPAGDTTRTRRPAASYLRPRGASGTFKE